MKPPRFWQDGGWQAVVLSPLEGITARLTARRLARPGWQAPVPVICCGNATVGGSGKTPLALDILSRLQARGIAAHALTRGHGGSAQGVIRCEPATHDAAIVGDEALLLAASAPCWIGADRAAAARAAIAAGAEVLVMDDGLQNGGLRKTASLLVIDGGAGFGNGHLLPAGPLREPVASAASRCQAAVIIGDDVASTARHLSAGLPVLRARMEAGAAMSALSGQTVCAFAGIGRPAKFFATLRDTGVIVAAEQAFPDHHRYTARDLAALHRLAASHAARLVTTAKDHVRLSRADRQDILRLDAELRWDDPDAFESMLSLLLR